MKFPARLGSCLAVHLFLLHLALGDDVHIPKLLKFNSSLKCTGSAYECACNPIKPTSKPRVYRLSVSLYLPEDSQKAPEEGWPLIAFFHGFGGKYILHNGDYEPYRVAATTAGYAFVEYDIQYGGGFSETATDTVEVEFLDGIIDWLKNITEDSTSAAYQKIDLTKIAAAGHSRGGKLAALHFGRGKHPIFTAYLADPVDCPCFAPCNSRASTCYPSGLEALKKLNKPVGLSGALVKGCCNPTATQQCNLLCSGICLAASHNATCIGNDYRDFLQALPGSVNFTANAGHMQFAYPNKVIQIGGNLVCGGTDAESYDISAAAAAHMINWIDRHQPSVSGAATETIIFNQEMRLEQN